MIHGNRITVYIQIKGIVQGVGFRPFVARLAHSLRIAGSVCNTGGEVEIIAEGGEEAVRLFVEHLRTQAPPNAHITDLTVTPTEEKGGFTEFTIVQSTQGGAGSLPGISPDLPVCEDCLKEMVDPKNRRYRYPLISCASCGPRYSIMDALPYDRDNTSMVDFKMCQECANEYGAMHDRRYHAQTLSCPACGPQIAFEGRGNTCTEEAALQSTVQILKNGGIAAVKGIGGFHYACSPFDDKAVKHLRLLKRREEKPFAVMFGSLDELEKYCMVNAKEKELLLSAARPIVLLLRKESAISDEVYKDSRFLGAFLPYTPLQVLLLTECGPLVMTSANLSGELLIKDEAEMLAVQSPYLDGVLYHPRAIRVREDDSVARIADNETQIIRLARGCAPLQFRMCGETKQEILAAGGDLKAGFCLLKNGQATVSPYFGDLENPEIYKTYQDGVDHLEKLIQVTPKVVACDLHPGYYSTRYAQGTGLPLVRVQHHYAHVASVMAEHDLEEPVIGVAFDGTGYGTDGAVWGGEFLLCSPGGFERLGHLAYTNLCGGDAAARDGWRSALCFLYSAGLGDSITDDRFPVLKAAIDNNINTALCSSMGRLFDAVSSILGISESNAYEGQSAILLENAASTAMKNGAELHPLSFTLTEHDGVRQAGYKELLLELLTAKREGMSVESLAYGFHEAVAKLVFEMCMAVRNERGVDTVALSGGVFQNQILLSRCLALLRQNGFTVYTNHLVPPNDGGIALGQVFVAAHSKGRRN